MSISHEISVMAVRGILLVTVPADPSDQTISTLQNEVLSAMDRTRSRGLILDIATVEVLDSFFARTLSETAQMVTLMGGRTVITGMRPGVAITATELGLRMPHASTALNVDRALDALLESTGGRL